MILYTVILSQKFKITIFIPVRRSILKIIKDNVNEYELHQLLIHAQYFTYIPSKKKGIQKLKKIVLILVITKSESLDITTFSTYLFAVFQEEFISRSRWLS